MSAFHSNMLLGSVKTADLGDPIEQSLRFRKSQYLERSAFTSALTGTQTWSIWFKRGNLQEGVNNFLIGSRSNGYGFGFHSNYPYQLTSNVNFSYLSNELFRDPSAWYHLVVSGDSSSSQQWINGVELTGITTLIPSYWTIGDILQIGTLYSPNSTWFFDGYMADIYLVDGQALQPTTFGRYNDKGVWVPKTPTISSYGTNGFHLTFDPSQTNGIGHDSSGQGNHFTATGFDTTSGNSTYDIMEDSPTNNHATWNPNIVSIYQSPNYSYANLATDDANGTGGAASLTTIQPPQSGKYYYETYWIAKNTSSSWANLGFLKFDKANSSLTTAFSTSEMFSIQPSSQTINNFGNTSSSTGWTLQNVNDVVGWQWDIDNNQVTITKNGANSVTVTFNTTDRIVPAIWSALSHATTGINVGQQPFQYTPPTGFKPLSTANLTTPTIADGSEHFQAITDTGANILTTAQTAFPDGLWWIKDRANTNQHQLVDSVRGSNLALTTPTLGAETSYSAPTGNSVAWCWNYNSSNPSQNGFDIVTYTGNATVGRTVSHNLGKDPEFIITKERSAGGNYWCVYHVAGGLGYSYLNTSGAYVHSASSPVMYTGVSNTTWTLDNNGQVNGNGINYVSYAWTSVPGYSAFDSFTGNGNADGPFVYTGFRPAFVMMKTTNTAGDWWIYDSTRSSSNPITETLQASLTSAEDDQPTYAVDFLSNGFKIRNSSVVSSGQPYIYAAFAENPFGGENTAPATAR